MRRSFLGRVLRGGEDVWGEWGYAGLKGGTVVDAMEGAMEVAMG